MSVRRLILFDIDGTLIWGGPAKDAFQTALLDTFGTTGRIEGHSFAGKTDPQIARELLSGAGLPRDRIDAGLHDMWPRYLALLETMLVERPVDVLAGVPELLDLLETVPDVGLGLLTGNIEGGARLKLRSAELWERFHVGSYGSDHADRDELPAIALERARARWGAPDRRTDVVVVGDTPRDVACGRKGGARTLAVATGRYSVEQLDETGADRVLADLTATRDVLEWLTA